jgi:hypothetical protein
MQNKAAKQMPENLFDVVTSKLALSLLQDRIMTRRLLILSRAVLLTAASAGAAADTSTDAPSANTSANTSSVNPAPAAAATPLQERLTKLGYARGEAVDKVQNYRVDGWNYLDDKHIMIYAGPSVRYLISTQISCSDLSSAEHIGFSSTANSLTKFDKIVVRGAGGMIRNCPIDAIHQLTSLRPKS